jgi:hypothetical protein
LGSYMYWVWSYVRTALPPSGSLHTAVRWIMHCIRLSAGDGQGVSTISRPLARKRLRAWQSNVLIWR